MFKFLLIITILAGVGIWVAYKAPVARQRVVEFVNPAAKEKRLLGDISARFDVLEKIVSAQNGELLNGSVAGAQKLISESRELIEEILVINDTKSAVTSATTGRILELARNALGKIAKQTPATPSASFSFEDEGGMQYICVPR